jgi:outer membrane protein
MIKKYCPAILVLCLTLTGSAQQRLQLRVEDAVRIGFENSKLLHSSRMRAESSEAKASEINASRLPSFKVNAGYTRLSDIAPFQITLPGANGLPTTYTIAPSILNNYNLKASVSQPLFTGFRLESAHDAAMYSARASREDVAKDEQEFIYGVKSAYWNFYRAIELKKLVDENVEQVEAHLGDAENLLAQGLVTTNDVLKIRVQLSTTRLAQIDAKNNVRLSLIALDNTLGLPLTTVIELSTTLSHLPTEFDGLDSLIEEAYGHRPDVMGSELRVKAGESGVTSAKGSWWPQINLVANYYDARPNPRIFPAKDVFQSTWDLGVNLSLDIWNWGTTIYQAAQAEAQLAQARDAAGLLKDGIALEVTQNYLALMQAKEKIGVSRDAVQQAEENSRVTGDKYREGLVLTSDVLDADVALLVARTNYTQSLIDYELAEARLLKSVGR